MAPLPQALIDFENVLSMEPKNYLGDNFARVTEVYRVTQYNIACCFAALKQVSQSSRVRMRCLDRVFLGE